MHYVTDPEDFPKPTLLWYYQGLHSNAVVLNLLSTAIQISPEKSFATHMVNKISY